MEFKERLLNEIKSAGLDNFSDRLLNRKLGIYSTFEKREVTKALDELVHDGVLVSVEKGNYTLKDRCDAVSGVLRGNRRGFAFLIRDDGKADLFIPHKGLHGAQKLLFGRVYSDCGTRRRKEQRQSCREHLRLGFGQKSRWRNH